MSTSQSLPGGVSVVECYPTNGQQKQKTNKKADNTLIKRKAADGIDEAWTNHIR